MESKMLVLSRTAFVGSNSLTLGDGVTYPFVRIVVTQLTGNKVRIGIEAPPQIKIARTELLEAAEKTCAG